MNIVNPGATSAMKQIVITQKKLLDLLQNEEKLMLLYFIQQVMILISLCKQVSCISYCICSRAASNGSLIPQREGN